MEEYKTKVPTTDSNQHYKQTKIEALFVIEDWKLGFNLGNVLKYISRMGRKSGESSLTALHKAKFYLEREIEICENSSDRERGGATTPGAGSEPLGRELPRDTKPVREVSEGAVRGEGAGMGDFRRILFRFHFIEGSSYVHIMPTPSPSSRTCCVCGVHPKWESFGTLETGPAFARVQQGPYFAGTLYLGGYHPTEEDLQWINRSGSAG